MSKPTLTEIVARLDRLEKAVFGGGHPRPKPRVPHPLGTLDFGMPVRPFIKRYSKGMSGPKKFTLLLARLVKGDPKKQIQVGEIEKHWDKMTSLMGIDFNRFFPSQAKDNDWVESKRKGFYNLRPGWKDIFSR
ncbi:MAG: hypothetical protein ACE5HL_07590 [Terriglobia bacterium]